MSAAFHRLMGRLEKVRATPAAPGCRESCRSLCPVCDKHGTSLKLSIALSNSGGTLIHCFAGCSATEVAEAVGMDIADLMPPSTSAGGAGGAFKGGQTEWASVASLSYHLAWAAAAALAEHPESESIVQIHHAAHGLHRAAIKAMAGERRK